MKFQVAMEVIFKFEGGYVCNPNDPGGETNLGISKRSYPNCNIKNLTKEYAALIYRMDYWDACHCDKLPECIRLMVFDCAVNQGAVTAKKFLQRCIGVNDDGIIGPITIKGLQGISELQLVNRFSVLRLRRYTDLTNWKHFGKGWTARLLEISIICANMAR